MASILRQIVAGPRAQHPEAGLDLCYVTDNIIATSGPGATYPQVAYRNPLKDLVKFLDSKHADQWAIWEFRAEGTGYPDSEVYGRVWHYPWPDHHPPPFALIPLIMGSMRNWLKDKDASGRVVVVHCKAGKGRSGTISCSYLISEEGWTPEEAMTRFTERRMRPGFGVGISIPSQRRWISYVDRWTKNGKLYVERPVEILELHVWGLRDGVKISVEGYVEEGKVIKKFHTFHKKERELVRGAIRNEYGIADVALEMMGRKNTSKDKTSLMAVQGVERNADELGHEKTENSTENSAPVDGDVVFRPSSRVVLPSSDVNIDFERRNNTKYGGFTMVTAVAHVWFNTFFEGQGPENGGNGDDSGVFELDWDAMDGIKGSSRKGTRAFDKFAVVWKALDIDERKTSVVINEPAQGEEVQQATPADWRGNESVLETTQKKLGMRLEDSESATVSRASSMQSHNIGGTANESAEELDGVKSDLGNNQHSANPTEPSTFHSVIPAAASSTQEDEGAGALPQIQLDGVPGLQSGMQHASTTELPDGKPESEMKDHQGHSVGHIYLGKPPKTSS